MSAGRPNSVAISRQSARHVVALGLVLLSVTVVGAALGGVTAAESQSGPIEISDWTDLNDIRNDTDADYVLVNDLNETTPGYETVAGPNANGGKGFAPIGGFNGSFDGQGNSIANLTIDRPSENEVGLFGDTSGGAVIEEVILTGAIVTGSIDVGGLVGDNEGTVSTSSASGNVTGPQIIGGLVGSNFGGTVSTSSASGNVTGTRDVGGLVGGNFASGTVSTSSASSAVNANGDFSRVGGLVGRNFDGTVSNSSASGNVTGSDSVGGLVGDNSGTVSNSSASGAVNATDPGFSNAGGLVGVSSGTVSNSSASGAVTGSDDVGGLVGRNGETVSNSSASGAVNGSGDVGGLVGANIGNVSTSSASGAVTGSGFGVGGLVGVSSGTVSNASASGAVTGSDSVGGLVGFNSKDGTVSTSSASGIVNATSRFSNVGGLVGQSDGTVSNSSASGAVTGSENVGGLVGDNGGTVSNASASGAVTGSDSVGGLVGFNSKDGTVSTSSASGIVNATSRFSNVGGLVGQSDGTVSTSSASGAVTGSENVGGLVGVSSGTVSNASASATVNAVQYVGGLVGVSSGTVSNSSASGAVNGSFDVGGLVGNNFAGTVSNSSASGAVNGSLEVGGLVGVSSGTVSNSSASGDVNGSNIAGGLVGDNFDGMVSESFATGAVTGSGDVGGLVGLGGTVTGSYWDIQATGQSQSAGGIGLNTTQMQGASAAQNMEALDFTNTWQVVTNPPGYPELRSLPDGPGPDPPLTAVFNVTPKDPTVGEQLTLNADTSTPESDIESYNWTLGDGTTATGKQVTHTYTNSGKFTVELTVQDGTETDTATEIVNVSAPPNSIEISDWSDLDDIRNDTDADYVLVNDLNETTPGYETVAGPSANGGKGFAPIGGFNGSFDGQGNSIANLTIDRPSENEVGLFGDTSGGAVIEEVILTGAIVTGSIDVGGLVGENEGNVTGSEASGAVNGSNDVGGLVGFNDGGTVSTSSASGAVNGSDNVGGLVGINSGGTVSTSSASASVNGSDNVGGLVGGNFNGGTVNESSASGAVNGSNDVGGLVGINFGAVSNSSASDDVTGTGEFGKVGGLVGINFGAVSNSSASGDVTGTGEFGQVGGLVGGNNEGNVTGSEASGAVTGSNSVGGLVGSNFDGNVTGSEASGDVDGSNDVGGLVGGNEGTVSNSSASGAVTGSENVGGLVGDNGGTVSNSSASGAVTGSEDVGGLVGDNFKGTVSESFATGAVTGSTDVGGLVGQLGDEFLSTGEEAILKDSYYDNQTTEQQAAVGAIKQGDGTAELRGEVAGLPTSQMQGASAAQNMGALDFTNTWRVVTNPPGYPELRGLPDSPDPSLTAGFTITPEDPTVGEQLIFDADPSTPESDIQSYDWNLGDGTTATGKQVTHTYTDSGQFTVELTVQDGTKTDTATEIISVSAASSSVEISDWTDLDDIRNNLNADYVLVNDLNETTPGYNTVASPNANGGKGFDPIGSFSDEFTGSFDGQGNTIDELTINRPNENGAGLFGYTSGDAVIEEVIITGAIVNGFGGVGGLVGGNSGGTVSNSSASAIVNGSETVGGLVGINSGGTVSNSSASGAVTANFGVGGLVGGNSDGGTVSNSSASGAVNGSETAGGLVGFVSSGTVSESFATGAVTGSSNVGGLVGQLGAEFLDPGEEAILRDSYYDTQTTEQQAAVGTIKEGDGTAELRGEVAGLPTSQMQGAIAAQNMDTLDFTNTWRVVTNPPGYPELRSLPDGPDPEPPLTAGFTITPEDPTVGEQLIFDADPSTPESDIESYDWTLGDGTTATGKQVMHTYTNSGQFTVELTVQDGTETDTATETVSVSAPSGSKTLSVTAKNATGETVSGAELILYTEDSEIVASRQTNQSGVASWSTLTSGEYSVELYGPSGAFWGATAVTVAGDNTSATVQRTAPRLSQVTLAGDENGDGGYYGGRPVTVSPEIQNDGAERPVRVQIKLDTNNNDTHEQSVLRGGGGTSIPTGEIGYYGYEFDPETNGTKQVRVVTETEINDDWIVTDDSGWIKSFEIEHNIVGFEPLGTGDGVRYSNSTTDSFADGVQAGDALLPEGTSLSEIELPGTDYETKNTSAVTEQYPWSAVGAVRGRASGPAIPAPGRCSGVLVEDNHVITAGHCMYNLTGTISQSVTFTPGTNSAKDSVTQPISIEFVQMYKHWVHDQNRTYDIAVLTLAESASSETGTFGYEAHSEDAPVYGSPWNPFDKEPAHLTGYPDEDAPYVDRGGNQWDVIVQGEGTDVLTDPLIGCVDTSLCHDYASGGLLTEDTFSGQSGGPVWQSRSSKPSIISIHSGGSGDGIGVRITERKHNNINEMIAHGYEQINESTPGVETPNSPPDGSSGSATGDPHLTTYDGVAYDFQAVGEFVLTNGSDNTPQVQARLRPIDTGAVSVISAVATQINGTPLTIDARDQQALTVNGTSQSIEPGESLNVENGEIIRTSEKYIVVYPGADGVVDDGDSRLGVTLSGDRLDAAISLNRTAVDSVSGLLGSPDGNASNDLVLANGTVLSSSPSFETLYGQYRDDYRVTAETSLFDYEGGESASGFFDPTYPSQRVTVDDLSDATQEQAIDAASAAGLEPGTAQFRDAVIDYALTGNQSYLDSASRAARQTSSSVDATPSETSLTAPGLSVTVESSRVISSNQSLNVSVAASHPDPGNVTVVISNSTEIVYEQNVTGAFNSEQTISWNTRVDGNGSLASAGNYTLSVIATTQAGVENITTSGFTLESPTPPPLPGYESAPQDPDRDGLFEDVDGDGEFTIFDVQAFFVNFQSETVRSNPTPFNFDESAGINIFDVQALFTELS